LSAENQKSPANVPVVPHKAEHATKRFLNDREASCLKIIVEGFPIAGVICLQSRQRSARSLDAGSPTTNLELRKPRHLIPLFLGSRPIRSMCRAKKEPVFGEEKKETTWDLN